MTDKKKTPKPARKQEPMRVSLEEAIELFKGQPIKLKWCERNQATPKQKSREGALADEVNTRKF